MGRSGAGSGPRRTHGSERGRRAAPFRGAKRAERPLPPRPGGLQTANPTLAQEKDRERRRPAMGGGGRTTEQPPTATLGNADHTPMLGCVDAACTPARMQEEQSSEGGGGAPGGRPMRAAGAAILFLLAPSLSPARPPAGFSLPRLHHLHSHAPGPCAAGRRWTPRKWGTAWTSPGRAGTRQPWGQGQPCPPRRGQRRRRTGGARAPRAGRGRPGRPWTRGRRPWCGECVWGGVARAEEGTKRGE